MSQPENEDFSDEVLVAYLDGQLSSEECEHVEELVARDEPTRQRLQSFDRVWNALDALPRSTASPSFTRTTIDMAVVKSAEPEKTETSFAWRQLVPAWAVAGLCGLLIGFVAITAVGRFPERRAATMLPVALHATALEQAGSIDFLNRLSAEQDRLLTPFASDQLEAEAATWSELVDQPPLKRLDWVASLERATQARFSARVTEFESRTPAKQQQLRELAEAVDADPNASELRRVALVYEAMVARLPAGEQTELRRLDVEQRMRQLERMAPRWAREQTFELSDAERQRLRQALEKSLLEDRLGKLAEEQQEVLPEPLLSWIENRPALAPFGLTATVASMDRRPQRRFERLREAFDSIKQLWSAWAENILASLPDRIQVELSKVTVERQAQALGRLIRENSQVDLGSYFAELPADEIEQLMLLPKQELNEALEQEAYGLLRAFGSNRGPEGRRPPGFNGFGPPNFGRGRGRGRGPEGDSRRDESRSGGPPPPVRGRGA